MSGFEKVGDILKRMGYPVDFEETMAALTADIHKNSVDHGWWETDADKHIPAKLMLIVTEAAEAMEEFRVKGDDLLSQTYYEFPNPHDADKPLKSTRSTYELPNGQILKGKPCGFGVELADAMIRIRDLCGYLKIDIDKLVEEKHQYNKTREYRHGNKRA